MRTTNLQDLQFRQYLGLTATVFAALGVVVGVFGLLASLVGADVFIVLRPVVDVEGVGAGLLGLLAMPLFFAGAGVLVGALTYLPFRWLQRVRALFGGPRPDAPGSPSQQG